MTMIRTFDQIEGSPCFNCLIKMTCTKSFVQETACNEYRNFVRSQIRKINESLPNNNIKKKRRNK